MELAESVFRLSDRSYVDIENGFIELILKV